MGARSGLPVGGVPAEVSIHTPPWGRDRGILRAVLLLLFQFTRPRGGAIKKDGQLWLNSSFNSHAPVGARYRNLRFRLDLSVSIHTPPWGRDFLNISHKILYQFQFTRPRGGAITKQEVNNGRNSFNSHAPVGARFCDPDDLKGI